MSKFNTATARARGGTSPIMTVGGPTATNHYGAPAHTRDPRSELFLLAVSNMVGESTFYEPAGGRDSRYVELVRAVTHEAGGPEWIAGFLRWLRTDAHMRSASLVGAAEAAHQMVEDGQPGARAIVDSVLQRADEPGEFLAYWTGRYGRALPKPVKRGVADAVVRLYDERALIKHDTPYANSWRFADVIDLVHPSPTAPWQGELFAHALDRRHNRDKDIPESLTVLRNREALLGLPVEHRRAALEPGRLRGSGMTWEAVAGWLHGPMDADAWSALIPSMGYMALLRNLRNFDQAGVPDEVAEQVAARLADPEQVARSRQFPFRFLAAYRAVPSLRWGHALERALQASLANVPALPGRTLVLIDRSPSMFPGYWGSTPNASDISLADQAAVFGCAVALRAASPTVAVYGGTSREVAVPRAGSLLRFVDGLGGPISYTDTAGALARHYDRHDRVLIVTDEQTGPGFAPSRVGDQVPQAVPVYTWNLGGYRFAHGPSGGGSETGGNLHAFAGLTDAAFRMVPLLEAGRSAAWPWLESR